MTLRFFFPIFTLDNIFRKGDVLPFDLVSNSKGGLNHFEFDFKVSINSMGYRCQEFENQKSMKRILIVGDSFTFGYGVNNHESYPARLSERFINDSVEVINAGFKGCFSPDAYYLYLKEEAMKLQPDLIVIGLFIGNDIDHPLSDELIWEKVDSNGLPTKIISRYSYKNYVKDFAKEYEFLTKSHLFRLIFRALDKMERMISKESWDNNWEANSHEFLNNYLFNYKERTNKKFKEVKKILLATSMIAKENGSKLMFLLIPELLQIDTTEIPSYVKFIPELDIEKPQRILKKFFTENNIKFLDLLPKFNEFDASQLYYLEDRHWNKKGHNLASKFLYEYLKYYNFDQVGHNN